MGRLAQFTLPEGGAPATWRVVDIFEGEEIIALASGQDGSVVVGTGAGNLYRLDPNSGQRTLLHHFSGPVLSVTQDRRNGHWYIEHQTPTTLLRMRPDASLAPLPMSLPANPGGSAVLQVGPDGRLYRLLGSVGVALLEVYDLPLWAESGEPCGDAVHCEEPGVCEAGLCVTEP